MVYPPLAAQAPAGPLPPSAPITLGVVTQAALSAFLNINPVAPSPQPHSFNTVGLA